jgi:hypothetical protein
MIAYLKNNFLYLPIFKNGSTTYSEFLERNGWKKILTTNIEDFSSLKLWAHITDPKERHIKGLEQYLIINFNIIEEMEKNPIVAKMLMSAAFDQHSYSITMLLGSLMLYPIYWIPLDASIMDCTSRRPHRPQLTGNDLTNDFFEENNFSERISDTDNRNVTDNRYHTNLRERIKYYRELYEENYNQLIGNLLTEDTRIYNETIKKFVRKYG